MIEVRICFIKELIHLTFKVKLIRIDFRLVLMFCVQMIILHPINYHFTLAFSSGGPFETLGQPLLTTIQG